MSCSLSSMCCEGRSSDDIAAAVRGASNPRGRPPFGAQRQGGRAQSAPSRQRARTPPRDPKDHKCANCKEKGLSHLACPHPAKPMEKRRRHECNGEGHTALRCPNKGKTSSSARLAIADKPSLVFTVRDVVHGDGFRPVPRGAKICELPVKAGGISQKERKAGRNTNRFVSLASLDEDDQSVLTRLSNARPRRSPSIRSRRNATSTTYLPSSVPTTL